MEQIIITKPNGNSFPLLSKRGVINVKSATQNMALLGEDVVNISVETTKKQNYEIGDTINIFGRTYKMNQLPKIQKTGPHSFSYDLVFEGIQYDLIRVTFDLTIDTTNNQLQDFQANTLTGNLRRFAEVLLANVARVFPLKWELGNCPETANDKTLTFGESDNCLLVLQNLCKEFGTEFYIEQKNGKNIVHFGKVGQIFPHSFSYGKGKGIYKLERQNVSSSNIITRLKVYGSTKNITNKYRANRLCLPNKSKQQSYIENSEMIAKYGIWEATKHFENIAPTRTGTITGIVQGNVLKFVDSEMFNLNEKEADGQTTKYLLPNTTAKIHFNTGNLAGYQFDVQSYDHATRTFTIKKLTDERNDSFPNTSSAAFQFAIGDKYKLIDIALPPEFEQQAEQDLLQTGQKYYEQNSQPKVQYALSVSEDFVKRKLAGNGALRNVFSVGDYIPIVDEDIDVNKSIRIQSFQRDVFKPYQYTLTISDLVSTSIVNKIISELIEVDKVIQINQLQDPIKAKRGWRDSQEIFNKVFDNEGYFDVERIKPLSIETGMINVGSRMQQFSLPNVILSVENNNTSVRNTVGQLMHLTIEDTPRTWQIPESVQTNIDADFHYIYVRAWRIGSMASIYISKEQIKVDAEAAYYYFLVGYLGSIENGFRRIKTTYGFTQVSPGEITTGRIAPPEGNHFIELTQDSINVVGNLHITDGNINQIKQSISPDLLSLENRLKAFSEQKVNDLQVGGRNFVLKSRITTQTQGYYTGGIFSTQQDPLFGEVVRIDKMKSGNYQLMFDLSNRNYLRNKDLVYMVIAKPLNNAEEFRFGGWIETFTSVWNNSNKKDLGYGWYAYWAKVNVPEIGAGSFGINSVRGSWLFYAVGVFEANNYVDWSPAPEDVQAQLQAEQQARQTAINEAKSATESYAQAQADLAKTLAIAQADNNISQAEQRQIANATQKLQEAKTFAEQKVNELQISHRNHVLNSRITMNTPNVLSGGIKSLTKDPIYGDVVRYDRTFEGGGDFQFIFKTIDVTCLNNKDLIYMVIAKPLTDTGTFRFGIWSHTFNALDQNSSKKDLGNGWYCYWKKVNVPNVGGADIMGINSVYGSWLFYAVGIFEAKNYIDWQPNPQDIEKDLQHAKAWADMFNDAEKANVEKISKIFQKQDDFVNGTYQTHNTIATGAIMVGNVLGGNAGINGSGLSANDVRFWAGSNFANRANATFRVLDNGEVHATNAHISGQINATSGNVGGFDISANGLRAGNFTTNGLALLDSGIIFRNDLENVFAGIGTNMFPSITGIKGLQRLSYEGNDSSAVGLYIKVRPMGEDYFGNAIKRALQLDGNFFQKGASAIFEEAWIGQAHNDIIKTKLSRTHTYCFSGSYPALRHVYLPSRSEVQEITGATNVAFDLKISCLHNMSGTIRINGVADGYIRNTNGDIESGGNGYWNMGRGDSIVLRYCEGNYYIISYVR